MMVLYWAVRMATHWVVLKAGWRAIQLVVSTVEHWVEPRAAKKAVGKADSTAFLRVVGTAAQLVASKVVLWADQMAACWAEVRDED